MDLAAHENPILLFSGGKDSLATLLFMCEQWDDLTVLWVDPGAAHPAMREYVGSIAARVPHFVEVKGRQPEFIAQHGWPVDVLPARSAKDAPGVAARPINFIPYQLCCGANLWTPWMQYAQVTGSKLVITGQRKADTMRNHLRDTEICEIGGITYWNPLHSWSDEQVFSYLREQGEPLPPFYTDGATSSPDCWNCTAYLDHNVGRLQAMKRNEPQRWVQIKPVLEELDRRIKEDSQPLAELM